MDTRIKEWKNLKFCDPSKILPQLRQIQELVAASNLPNKVKNLRTHGLRYHREGWEATLFCYGMGQNLGTTIYLSPSKNEDSDYDAVSLWPEDKNYPYKPIQIKEIVPKSLNSETDINQVIMKLKKYTANDTIVVIHDNRAGKLDFANIRVSKLQISQLWILGTLAPDQSKWFILGDLLGNPEIFEFDHPL